MLKVFLESRRIFYLGNVTILTVIGKDHMYVKNDCCILYPLLKDGDISGIICIVVASIVYLAPRFWEYILITKYLDRKGNPCQYLHEPTKFHRYLRTVVMTWFSNENIDIEMIIDNRWILGKINKIISISDQENYENEKIGEKNQVASEETIKKETVVIDKENLKCSERGEIFSTKSNLKRYFDRKHKGVKFNNAQNGKGVCFQHGERDSIGFHVFIYETKAHSTDAGL